MNDDLQFNLDDVIESNAEQWCRSEEESDTFLDLDFDE